MGTIRRKLRLIVAALFLMLVTLFVFQELKTGTILALKKDTIRRTFQVGMEHINRRTELMQKSALDLAAAGMELHAIRRRFTRRELQQMMHKRVLAHVTNHPEALGGGIWYEPYRFFPDKKYTGPYAYWEKGSLRYTEKFADPSYHYPGHHWYRVAIPAKWDRQKRRPARIYWSRPYKDSVGSETNMITVNGLMYDSNGAVLGTATTDWGLAGLIGFLSKLEITPGSQSVLFHYRSKIVFYNSLTRRQPLTAVSNYPWLPLFDKMKPDGIRSTNTTVNIKNKLNHYAVYSGLSDSGLCYTVLIPQSEFMPKIARINQVTRWLAVVSFLTVALFTLLTSRRINISLRSLTKRIASFGDGNFNVDFKINGNDELAVISLAFQDMSHRLKQNVNELQSVKGEKEQLEERYLQAQKLEAVGRLAGGVAHDFNNILQVVFGYGELLRQQYEVEDGNRELLEKIMEAAAKAAQLTRQLLAFSRKQILEKKQHNLNTLIRGLMPMLDRLIGENIILRDNLEEGLPDCMVDSGQIEQVLMNLTVNARDAMKHGGTLTFTTGTQQFSDEPDSHSGNYVVMKVKDTGSGIAPELLPKIFEPFFTTKESGKGTGLGLATVFGIIKQHGGWIDITSEREKGTEFTVYLPALAEAAVQQTTEPDEAVPLEGNGELLLLIEDDHNALELLTRYLQHHNYRTVSAGNAEEGLQLLRKHNRELHLVVSDIMLPDGSCFDLLPFRRPGLPVILMSGYIDRELYEKALREKNHTFLHKPFEMGRLLLEIRNRLAGAPPLEGTAGNGP